MENASSTNLHSEVEETVRMYNELKQELEDDYTGKMDKLLFFQQELAKLLDICDDMIEYNLPSHKKRGVIAELMLEEVAKRWLDFYKIQGDVICNSLLKFNNGSTSQLDLALVTDKCIFIIECKSLFGTINFDNKTLSFTSEFMEKPLTPFNQNQTHIEAFKEELTNNNLPTDMKIYNVVYIFSRGKLVEYLQPLEEDKFLLINKGAFTNLKELYDKTETTIPIDEMILTSHLLEERIPTTELTVEHINNIKRR